MNINDRIYLIGGSPRVGKSLLAQKLAQKMGAHIVGTDSIRHAARKAVADKNSDLFLITKHNDLSEKDWLRLFQEQTQRVVEEQNRESIAAWPATKGFINTFQDDNYNHIVEGVALLPSLVSELHINEQHIIYLGNTSLTHDETLLSYAHANPELDWMSAMNYSEARIRAQAKFSREMSVYFKQQAELHGFRFVDLNNRDFAQTLDSIVEELTRI